MKKRTFGVVGVAVAACVGALAMGGAQAARAAEQPPSAKVPKSVAPTKPAVPTKPPLMTLELKGTIRIQRGAEVPKGTCSQITITAWRTAGDYSSGGPLTAHEKTHAVGAGLEQCTYSLKVPIGKMVEFRSSITVKGWKVVSKHSGKTSFGPMIWEEKHPIVEDWEIQPLTPTWPTGPAK